MTDLSTPNLTALDEDRTPGKWDRVLPLGSVGIGNMSFPAPIDQTKRPGESWLQMRQRIHPELKQRDAEQEANARLCALAPDLLAEVLQGREREAKLLAEIERLREENEALHDPVGPAEELCASIGPSDPWSDIDRAVSGARAALKPQEE